MEKITIIGLGLLGGSFALALRKILPEVSITGVDISSENAKKALDLGIADQVAAFEEAIPGAQLVVLATPVDTIVEQLHQALELLNEEAILIDLGSTKKHICETADKHTKRDRFVAIHPIAGTENSGPDAAFSELFLNRMIILCDREKSAADALQRVESLLKKLTTTVEYMSSSSHDEHIAFVSHLSHISSFGLGATVLEMEKNEKNIFIMAGSGFDSTVRLAKSSPDMWAPIFRQNKGNISKALGLYIRKLQDFKDLLDTGDVDEMHRFMKETNDIRRVLKDHQPKD